MYAERHDVAITTDASGDATAYTLAITGAVHSIRYVPDGTSPLDTGADVTITGETSGFPVLTEANIGTSAFTRSPRQPTHKNSDGSALLYAASGEPVETAIILANERIKVVVAQGGNTKSGTLTFIIA